MEVVIDANLKLVPAIFNRSEETPDEALNQLIDVIKSTNGKGLAEQVTPYESLIPNGADAYHQNMACYVEACWNSHAGVVVRPDMIYFTVLNEVAKYVIGNADACRDLFTTEKSGKQNIVIVQDTDKCIEFDRLIEALKAKIPSKVDGLLPSFSTDSPMAQEARWASFAEAVSPYYRYFTTRCGISKVRLEGSEADWDNLCSAVKGWLSLLPSKEMTEGYLAKCLSICQQILADVRAKKMTAKFWKEIYWQVNCASGGPFVHGWLLDLYKLEQRTTRYSLRGHISRVKWTVLETGRKFVVHHGLFSSKLDPKDNYLVPEFSRIIFNRPKEDED